MVYVPLILGSGQCQLNVSQSPFQTTGGLSPTTQVWCSTRDWSRPTTCLISSLKTPKPDCSRSFFSRSPCSSWKKSRGNCYPRWQMYFKLENCFLWRLFDRLGVRLWWERHHKLGWLWVNAKDDPRFVILRLHSKFGSIGLPLSGYSQECRGPYQSKCHPTNWNIELPTFLSNATNWMEFDCELFSKQKFEVDNHEWKFHCL